MKEIKKNILQFIPKFALSVIYINLFLFIGTTVSAEIEQSKEVFDVKSEVSSGTGENVEIVNDDLATSSKKNKSIVNSDEDEAFYEDTSVPEITEVDILYKDNKGEFFIYGKNFGEKKGNIELFLEKGGVIKTDDIKMNIDNFYSTVVSGTISGDYKDGVIYMKKKISKTRFATSNKEVVQFGLPSLKKVAIPSGVFGGNKIIFTGENFKKPIYGLIGSNKIICEKDSETVCEITIPKNSTIGGDLGIESFGFKTMIKNNIAINKTTKVEMTSYSNNSVSFKIDGFTFKELIDDLDTAAKKKAFEGREAIKLSSKIGIYLDGKKLNNSTCKISRALMINCGISSIIYQKGIGYVDLFGLKTSFFSYDLSEITPYPSSFSKTIRWSTYTDASGKVVKGNRIYIKIGIKNFDYLRSNSNILNQSTKKDFVLIFGGTEYRWGHKDVSFGKDKLSLVLSDFPSKMKGKIYFRFGNVEGDSILYDFGDYEPRLYSVYKGDNSDGKSRDVFFIEGKNLTNFNNLEASLKFGNKSLSTGDIKKHIAEKRAKANSELSTYKKILEDSIKLLGEEEAKAFGNISDIKKYQDNISQAKIAIYDNEAILKDLANVENNNGRGLGSRISSGNSKKKDSEKIEEILLKSDTKIKFTVFDKEDYGRPLPKGEYSVSITSNGSTTNSLNFFYDNNCANLDYDLKKFIKKNKEKTTSDLVRRINSLNNQIISQCGSDKTKQLKKAEPKIENITFLNGAGDPSLIEIKGSFLDRVDELYFTDLKAVVLKCGINNRIKKYCDSEISEKKKIGDKMIVKIDPAAIIRKRGTIIAKMKNGKKTSNLFFYNFIDDKSNKVTLEWKKDDGENSKEITSDKTGSSGFELVLKNTYKDLIFKNLKVKIENIKGLQLPFYDFYLNSPVGKLKGTYDEKSGIMNFENKKLFEKIAVNEKGTYKFEIVFENIKSGVGEVALSIVDIGFYDAFNIKTSIPDRKIKFTKDPKFYLIKDSNLNFCKEINIKGNFVNCGSEISKEDIKNGKGVFSEDPIKSDFAAPISDDLKKSNFIDVPKNSWFNGYVDDLYKRGIIRGYGSGEGEEVFKPLNTITRAESVKILLASRNEQIDNLKYTDFVYKDVPRTHWAKNILEYTVRENFLKPSRKFFPNRHISRGEAAKLIVTFFGRVIPKYSKYSFLDVNKKDWFSDYAEYLFENNIISGIGDTRKFEARKNVTRSEFSKMISGAIKIWSK